MEHGSIIGPAMVPQAWLASDRIRLAALQHQRPRFQAAGVAWTQGLRGDEELGRDVALDFAEFLFESI